MIENKFTEEGIKEINKRLIQSLDNYRKTISFMSADAPIETLCLPKTIQTILQRNGFLRIYDIMDCDFTEIKGLGEVRIRDLTTRLNEFLSIC